MGVIGNFTRKLTAFLPNKSEKRSGMMSPYASTNPFSTLFSQVLSGYNNSGEPVTPETSLRYSAIYACVRNISEDIAKATINIQVFDSKTQNYINVDNTNIYHLLNVRPNTFSNAFAFKETMQRDALLKGNGYAYIKRDNKGNPTDLIWLQTESVNPMLVDLRMVYIVNDVRTGISGTFQSFDIFHLRGMGNGYVGLSVIGYAGESFGKALATQKFGAMFFGSNGVKGVLKFAGVNDETKLKKAKESFKKSYSEDGIAAINQGMEWEKVEVAPEEAQFIQSQEFNVTDIARWFRMPLSKLQKSDVTTDPEREAIEYVNDCLLSWQIRWEQEIATKLFTANEAQYTRALFDNSYLLKGDSASQERHIKTMFFVGAWSPNDALKYLGYNTLPEEEANWKYAPVNMIPTQLQNEFWQSKNPSSNIPQGSADSSGSGNLNNNIN